MRQIHFKVALIQVLHDVLNPPMAVDTGLFAMPCEEERPTIRIFQVASLAPTTNDTLQFPAWSAAEGSVYIHLPNQGADCDGDSDNYNRATFYLDENKELHLFASHRVEKKHRQRFWVDRTGQGQGEIAYTTGPEEEVPRYALRYGWSINESGMLVFRDTEYLACPGYEGGNAWKIFLEDITRYPEQKLGCVKLGARVVDVDKPVSCVYTRRSPLELG